MHRTFLLALAALVGCGDSATESTGLATASGEDCAYPKGKQELALDKVMPTWWWDDARHRDGRVASLEIDRIPCATDDDIDWSPFDVLLFVSIPAW